MLLRSGPNWIVDYFVRRGWLVKRRLRRRQAPWNPAPTVPAECLEDRTLLSTITVTSLADTTDPGTLRNAVATANAGDKIVFQSGLNGEIDFASGDAPITISAALTITGNGAANTIINAQGDSRIFEMTGGAGNVTLSGLTLENGKTTADSSAGGAIQSLSTGMLTVSNTILTGNTTSGTGSKGGAIYTAGTLTLTGCALSGNSTAYGASGGAAYSVGAVTVTNSDLTDNTSLGAYSFGGAIFSLGGGVTVTNSSFFDNSTNRGGGAIATSATVTVSGSVLSGNSTLITAGGSGGAIVAGTANVSGSTLSGNTAARTGGAIEASNTTVYDSTLSGNSANTSGGAIFGAGGHVTLTNSTISGNTAASFGGGIYALYVTATNSTIAENHATNDFGGGIWIDSGTDAGSLNMNNSILAQNTDAGSDPDLAPGTATLTISHSLIGDNTGTVLPWSPFGDANGNLIGMHSALMNPMLGALANDGGPTQTMALLPGSPAIDAGKNSLAVNPANGNSPLTTDQRGAPFVRIVGAAVDMGAFEAQPVSLVVSSAADQLDATFNFAQLTLRDAVTLADNLGGGAITFSPALNGTPLLLTQGQLTISSPVTITGNGPANTIINAQDNSRIFNFTSGAGNVALSGMTLENGETTASADAGGAIASASSGTLAISNSVFTGNYTTGNGSASGGAIDDSQGPVTITGSIFSGNGTKGTGSATGGAINMGFGALTISNSTFSGDFTKGASAAGGAIQSTFGNLTVTNSTLSGNSTQGTSACGGAINAVFATVYLTNSTLTGNFTSAASSQGGAIFSTFANITVTNSTIVDNHAAQSSGGAISTPRNTLTLSNSIVAQNTDDGTAADMSVIGATLAVSHSLIGDNTDTGLTAAPVGSPDANGNLIGTHAFPINPLLGLPDNNGGPTLTMALLAGSPAINAGSNALAIDPGNGNVTLTTDQRGAGFSRIAGGTVDMGAYEIQSHVPAAPTVNALVANTSTPVLTGTWDQVNAVVLQVIVNGMTYILGSSPQLVSNGSGNWTLTVSAAIPDGTYNVTVNTSNDIGESANVTATNALIVETAAPAAPTVNSLVTNHNKPVLTGTFDQTSVDKATVLQVTVNGTVFTLGSSPQLASDGSGNWTLTTTATIPDGTYTVLVHTANAAGFNANDTATNALIVDTVPPAVPTVNALVANTSTPVVTGTWDQGTPGGAVVLTVTVNGTVFTFGSSSQLTSDGSGHWTLTTTAAIPDGTYTVAVHTADAAGNIANSTTSGQLLIETVGPISPTANSLVTNNNKPVLTGTFDQSSLDKATILQVTLNGTVYTLGSSSQLASDGSGHWTLTTTATIPDGTYTVSVHTANAAGFNSDDTATNALVVDTVAPATSNVNSLVTNNSKPVLTGTWDQGTPGGAIVLTVTVNGTVFTFGTSPQLTSNGSGHWTLTTTAAIPDGTYTVAVHTVDAAGNVANSTTSNQLQIETAGPLSPTVNALVTNINKPVLTGTFDQTSVDKATLLQVSVNETAYTLGTSPQLASDGSGHWTLTTTTVIPDGIYTVLVHTSNAAGFAADLTATNALVVDTVPPATPTVNSLLTNNSKPVLTGTWGQGTPGGATVLTVTVGGTVFTFGTSPQLTSDGSGHWTLTTTATIPDGTYTVLVHTADAAGNVANSTTSNQLIVDTTPPATPSINYQITGSNLPVITGTWDQGTPGGAVLLQVTVNGTTFTLGTSPQLTSDGFGNWTLTTTVPIPNGAYNVMVHTADAAGNTADFTATDGLFIGLAPPAATLFTGEYVVSIPGSNVLPRLAYIAQSGNSLSIFGSVATTAIVLPNISQLVSGGSVVATFQNSSIFFNAGALTGQFWTKLDLPANFINPAGAIVHAQQIGTVVNFIDKFGNLSRGTWINPTQLSAFGETVTVGNGILTWSDGSVWREDLVVNGTNNGSGTTTLSEAPSHVTVVDYNNGNGSTVHVVLPGTNNLVFIDRTGHMALGTYISSNQAVSSAYPNDVATFVGNKVVWQDGTTWTQITPATTPIVVADYTNSKGVPVHTVTNGTSAILFVDGVGNLSLGTLLDATHAIANLYPGDVATFNAGGVSWQDGTIWTKASVLPPVVTFTDSNGAVSRIQLLTPTTLIGLSGEMQGISGTRANGTINWSNGAVWQDFDLDAINALFEMGTVYP